jgi:hypothetical protein
LINPEKEITTMRVIILITLALLSKGLQAQNITTATLAWSITRTQVINTGEMIESGEQLISYGRNTAEWQNSRGEVKKSFTVIGVNGAWGNVQLQGSIVYDVQCGDKPGTITFQRTAGGVLIRILLLNGEEMPDIYEMTVSTINAQ